MLAHARLSFSAPLNVQAIMGSLRAHAIPGSERVSDSGITRIITVGSATQLVTVAFASDAVTVSVGDGDRDRGPVSAGVVEQVSAIVRHWFDLDLRPDSVTEELGDDPIIGPLLTSRPGLRVVGAADGGEAAVMAVLGQQVSLARARALGGKVVAAFGSPGPGGLSAFPSADVLAAIPTDALREALGLTNARARALHGVVDAVADGLDLSPAADPERFRAGLLQIPGIGPWTTEYLAVRVLGDRNAFTPSDLVLRRALGGISAREASMLAERWQPYRAYALCHLWTEASY